ncbi:DUF935 domain-containing protein [Geoalkalibacter halelectricus]|uniref:DUF935 domain-containing protein n=1 Tax=Geoalkalibacter halelectricus TaxID=2847045 RepID=UPI003D20B070
MVTLYDHRNQPIRPAELKGEPQTARLSHLHREFAEHPSRGLTPAKLARIFEDAESGDLIAQAQLAEDMEEKDAHLYAELQKRKLAVLAVDWDLRPPVEASAKEIEATSHVETLLRELDMDGVLLDLAAGILPGYAGIEIDWDYSAGQWFPQGLHYRPADWFMTAQDARDELRLRTPDGQGEALRPWGWIVHRHRAKSGYVARGGLVRVLAWPFLFRNYAARDLAEFLEIYGLPLRLGHYPPGSSAEEKATLMRAVAGIGHAAAGIIPEGMRIEFQEAAKGASDPFTAMMSWAEKSMSKAILGGTLGSQTDGGGAYALGEIHDRMRLEIRHADLRQIAATLTRQLVTPLLRLNTGVERVPALVFDAEEPEDLKLYAESLPKLVQAGLRIPARWAREKLKIPAPDEGEEVLSLAASPLSEPTALRTMVAASAARPVSDAQAGQLALLEQQAHAPLAQMLEVVRRKVEQAASLEELRDSLLDAWPQMDSDQLAEVMAQALAAAAMAGRYEILEGL